MYSLPMAVAMCLVPLAPIQAQPDKSPEESANELINEMKQMNEPVQLQPAGMAVESAISKWDTVVAIGKRSEASCARKFLSKELKDPAACHADTAAYIQAWFAWKTALRGALDSLARTDDKKAVAAFSTRFLKDDRFNREWRRESDRVNILDPDPSFNNGKILMTDAFLETMTRMRTAQITWRALHP